MSAELHRRASDLFLRMRAVPVEDRAAALRQGCAGDEALRREVESLLAHDSDDQFLSGATGRHAAIRSALDDATMPRRIGSFQVLEGLGEGGMGVVYRAAQDHPRREVALKMMRGVLPSESARRRFEREADLLGRLQHPGVAQVYEAGTADGQPWFAMELIAGQSITDYVNQQALTTNERLSLLARVCDAVQHAHQRGVIHRDLKPANILVDAGGNPRVLDFGVARALDADDLTRAVTQTGQLLGTPRYMAPEQFLGDPDKVDARCDVYALGAIGFELLTGRPPLDFEGLSLAAIIDRARSAEPPPLGACSAAYRGDVETIVATALARDPERRYPSVGQLAEDIRRFLRDETIFARPATLTYQLRKFARRRRGLVIGAFVVFATLVLGGLVSTWALVRTVRANAAMRIEQERTLRTTAKNQLSLDFMRTVLTSVDPMRGGQEVRLVDALDDALPAIGTTFSDWPDTEANVRYTFGQAYKAHGKYDAAREQFERSIALAQAAGTSPLSPLKALAETCIVARDARGAADAGGKLLERSREDETYRPHALHLLAQAHFQLGDLAAAESWSREAIAANESLPENLGPAYDTLAIVLKQAGRLDEAEECYQRAIELYGQHRGPEENSTLIAKMNYTKFLALRGNYQQAESILLSVRGVGRNRLGPAHPTTLAAVARLGNLYSEWAESSGGPAERFDQAAGLLEEALAGYEGRYGPDHSEPMTVRGNLASLYMRRERYADAEPLFRRTLDYDRRVSGNNHPRTMISMNNLARALHRLEQLDESDALYKELLGAASGVFPEDHYQLAAFRMCWAMTLVDLRRLDEAESLLRSAQPVLVKTFGPDHLYARRAAETLEQLDEARRRE